MQLRGSSGLEARRWRTDVEGGSPIARLSIPSNAAARRSTHARMHRGCWTCRVYLGVTGEAEDHHGGLQRQRSRRREEAQWKLRKQARNASKHSLCAQLRGHPHYPGFTVGRNETFASLNRAYEYSTRLSSYRNRKAQVCPGNPQ